MFGSNNTSSMYGYESIIHTVGILMHGVKKTPHTRWTTHTETLPHIIVYSRYIVVWGSRENISLQLKRFSS